MAKPNELEINVVTKRENRLLERLEVNFKVFHQGPTPSRQKVREKLASVLNADTNCVIIDHIRTAFGTQETIGYAKVYKSTEIALKTEPKAILRKNKLTEEKIEKKVEKKRESKQESGAAEK